VRGRLRQPAARIIAPPATTEAIAGACRPRQRPPFSAKVGLGKAREELGAIAGIVEWVRVECWLRASLG